MSAALTSFKLAAYRTLAVINHKENTEYARVSPNTIPYLHEHIFIQADAPSAMLKPYLPITRI